MWNGKRKALTFSYDDGITQDIRLIRLLDKYGLKCTFNVNSGLLGKREIINRNNRDVTLYRVTSDEVAQIYRNHEIASHGMVHAGLSQLSEEEIVKEIEEDRKNLTEISGKPTVGLAYAGGNYDERVIKVLREHTGIRYARTIESSYSFSTDIPDLLAYRPTVHAADVDNLFTLGRKFLSLPSEETALFYIWGHSFEMDAEMIPWEKLEEFFSMMSGKDDIFYGTNEEVFSEFLKERERTWNR